MSEVLRTDILEKLRGIADPYAATLAVEDLEKVDATVKSGGVLGSRPAMR